ncbi:aldolase/citrate lyase family protein [Sphingomonas gei]|uniref:aldolase/citrate lyase family protein n=1 Tax=Sphingomonas gei TaxID=1395960 RepID=UPI00144267ED|nr:aldolase/citrate lyase family protein [Sphingomonas gei]
MKFFFITNSPGLAAFAVRAGVDRIFVDLEILGKQERQGHLNTLISGHSFEDLRRVRAAVPDAELMARLNPMNAGTQAEVDEALDAGVPILMLPMFHEPGEVQAFADCVRGRARICLLAETIGAMQTIRACAETPGVDEIHIGLNDLSLDLELPFMFQPLAMGLVDQMAEQIRAAGKPFGIGGVARIDEGLLPARWILGEHARLGSTAAILSRTFHRQAVDVTEIEAQMDFAEELRQLRTAYRDFCGATPGQLEANHARVCDAIGEIAREKAARPHLTPRGG